MVALLHPRFGTADDNGAVSRRSSAVGSPDVSPARSAAGMSPADAPSADASPARPGTRLLEGPGTPVALRLIVDNGPVSPRRAGSLRSSTSGERARSVDGATVRSTGFAGLPVDSAVLASVAVLALIVFGGLLFVRLSQGGPAATTWDRLERISADANAGAVGSTVGTVGTGGTGGTVGTGGAGGTVGPTAAAPGDVVVTARPGDSMWSIAGQVAPGTDPRPVVATLIAVNGGESLQIGQQIVIPRQLLD